jgi:hypothetical protein
VRGWSHNAREVNVEHQDGGSRLRERVSQLIANPKLHFVIFFAGYTAHAQRTLGCLAFGGLRHQATELLCLKSISMHLALGVVGL